jgi:hypothetical protein
MKEQECNLIRIITETALSDIIKFTTGANDSTRDYIYPKLDKNDYEINPKLSVWISEQIAQGKTASEIYLDFRTRSIKGELATPTRQLREVKVTYSDGSINHTNVASGLSDDQIKEYWSIGREFNISTGGYGDEADRMVTVDKLEIIQ